MNAMTSLPGTDLVRRLRQYGRGDGRGLAQGRRRSVAEPSRSGRAARRSKASARSAPAEAGRRRSWRCSASSRRSSTKSRRAWRGEAVGRKRCSSRILAGVEAAEPAPALPERARHRPRHAQPAGQRAAGASSRSSARTRSELREQLSRAVPAAGLRAIGRRRARACPPSARSPAPGRPMSRASSPPWPRRARRRDWRLSSPRRSRWRPCSAPAGWPRRRGEAMDEVARRVASPNGTTEAGLAVLDRDGVLDRLIARNDRSRGASGAGRRSSCRGSRRQCPRRCPPKEQGNDGRAAHFRRPRRLDLVRRQAGPVARGRMSTSSPMRCITPRRCSRGSAPITAQIFKLTEHSERLQSSAALLGFEIPWSVAEIDAACNEVLKANDLIDAYMRPVAWRGSEQMGVAAGKAPSRISPSRPGNGANISTRRKAASGHPARHRAVAPAGALHRADPIRRRRACT